MARPDERALRDFACCHSEPECPLCPLAPVNAERSLEELAAAGLRANIADAMARRAASSR